MSKTVENEPVREEFNRWATAGQGEEMEVPHPPIPLPTPARTRASRSSGTRRARFATRRT